MKSRTITQHPRTGKARKVRQEVGLEIAFSERRGSIGDAALPRFGKLYFNEDSSSKRDAFGACGSYIKKLSKHDGDVFQRRYFYVGRRYGGVRIYEPFDIQTNMPETTIYQRLIWQEGQLEFVAARAFHRRVLEDQHQYMALFE